MNPHLCCAVEIPPMFCWSLVSDFWDPRIWIISSRNTFKKKKRLLGISHLQTQPDSSVHDTSYYITVYYVILYYIISYSIILCYIILYYVILYYIYYILYYIKFRRVHPPYVSITVVTIPLVHPNLLFDTPHKPTGISGFFRPRNFRNF